MAILNLENLAIRRVPALSVGIACTAFICTQVFVGAELFRVMQFALAFAISILSFNLLGGLRTVNGWVFLSATLYTLYSPMLIAFISSTSITAMGDPDGMSFDLILLAELAKLIAVCFLSSARPILDQPSMVAIRYSIEPILSARLIMIIVLAAVLWKATPPSSLFLGFFSLVVPFAYVVIAAGYRMNLIEKPIAASYVLVLISISWLRDGLSGMKSAIIYPIALWLLATLLQRIRTKVSTIMGSLVVLIACSTIAVSMQPLREYRISDPSARIGIALALVAADLEEKYGVSVPVPKDLPPELLLQMRNNARRNAKDKGRVGILNRMSMMADDAKFISAINKRGFIPFLKYFEEMTVIPRNISGLTFRTDKLSAFYGRYAGVIGRDNFTTGIAFSGHVTAFAHGGYLFAFLSTLIATSIFIGINRALVGESTNNLVAQLWLMVIMIEMIYSVQSIYQTIFRTIPSFLLFMYVMQSFAKKITSRSLDEYNDKGYKTLTES